MLFRTHFFINRKYQLCVFYCFNLNWYICYGDRFTKKIYKAAKCTIRCLCNKSAKWLIVTREPYWDFEHALHTTFALPLHFKSTFIGNVYATVGSVSAHFLVKLKNNNRNNVLFVTFYRWKSNLLFARERNSFSVI